ncbi:MAG TPA: ethanolamine ammonia-lyase subunit EutC [Terracidiphilus sp.]|jgi:ethanolamine ammonia-lyase small subunit|nr:ethanolamine ammonia-lyase subunit EutC [Terracidiphilus sp.]
MSEIITNSLSAKLRGLTPARVGLGRTGVSQATSDLLDFQMSHGRARDAVHARMDAGSLAAGIAAITRGPVLTVHSRCADRVQYLQRPDLGRELDDASWNVLADKQTGESADLALVVADGLSALAVERHVVPLLQEWWPRLKGWLVAPICVVEQGRVAVGDAIGERLGAMLSVVLIGERPGLSSPDSLGAYITWEPRVGRTDAERNCISNIRTEGLSYAQAAAQLSFFVMEARQRRLTGVSLKEAAPMLERG